MNKNFLEEVKNEITNQKNPHAGNKHADYNADAAFVAQAILTRSSSRGTRGYHIEFVFGNPDEAQALCEVLAIYDIFAKVTVRRGMRLVYIKNSDCICNLLALVAANKSLLKLHDEIAMRDIINVSNRRANCDTANITKQVAAAAAQIAAINALRESGKLDRLDHRLRQTASARLSHPDATYSELAKLLKISKSGIVHRLRELLEQE